MVVLLFTKNIETLWVQPTRLLYSWSCTIKECTFTGDSSAHDMRGEYRAVATSTGCYGEHTHTCVRSQHTCTRTPINANNVIAFSFEFSTHLQILHCTQLLRLTKLSPPVVSRFPFHQFCLVRFVLLCLLSLDGLFSSPWTMCCRRRHGRMTDYPVLGLEVCNSSQLSVRIWIPQTFRQWKRINGPNSEAYVT